MSRLRIGLMSVATLATAAMLLAAGPAGLVGSARSDTTATTPAGCAPTPDTGGTGKGAHGTASHGDMAGMNGMAGRVEKPVRHSTQELRDRLARTPSGGTLTVPAGVYEGALVIDSPITLVGVGHPVIRGDGTGTVLTIRAAGTTVRGLMIEGSGPGPVDNPAGVSVEADHVAVTNLHIRDTYTGVWVEGARDAQITGNTIEGRKSVAVSGESAAPMGDMTGDMADMSDMTMGSAHGSAQAGRGDGVSLFNAIRPMVSGNTIANVRDGVYLSYGSGTRIGCNSVTGSRYAIHGMYGKTVTVAGNHFATNQSGPVMMYGGPVTLEGNVIREQQSAATGFGVLLLDVSGARLRRNVLVSNRVGLQIEGSVGGPKPTAVELNTIALNQVGVGLYPTADASLTQNSFVENTVQVLGLGPDGAGGGSLWSRGDLGNYWSNYRGFQRSGGAGEIAVGAVPHVEGATAGRLLAGDPTLLALASSPAFTLLRAVEQRSASQHPVVLDRSPLVDPRSPSLPTEPTHAALGTGLVGAAILLICSLVLLRGMRRRHSPSGRTKP
ncbi:MAG: right-handed parallel beta-helix repeat-containing protein [Dermatophilaceae bacterium]|nr:right-handed parallel beta-helix repeat-containing protein [Dermatophilaceae bacterium]